MKRQRETRFASYQQVEKKKNLSSHFWLTDFYCFALEPIFTRVLAASGFNQIGHNVESMITSSLLLLTLKNK